MHLCSPCTHTMSSPPLWEILDPQLFIVLTFFFSNYQRACSAHNDVNHQSQVLDRYVADRCSQMRQENEQTQRIAMSHLFDILFGD